MKPSGDRYLNKIVPLILLVILITIIRIPINASYVGERDTDSAFFDHLSESIIADGFAKWLLHPASAFGLAEFSYPCFAPFALALASIMTGLTRLGLFTALSFNFGIIGMLVAYITGYAYFRVHSMAFFVAFAFSLNPSFIKYTNDGSFSRVFFLILFMCLIYIIINNKLANSYKYLLIIFFSFLILITHRMSLILLLLLSLSYISAKSYMILANLRGFAAIKANEGKLYLIIIVILFIFNFTAYYPFQAKLTELQSGLFFQGQSTMIMFLNMIFDYFPWLNPASLLISVAGILLILYQRNKNIIDWFFLFAILYCIPLLPFSYYNIHLLIPLLSIPFAISMKYISEIDNKFNAQTILGLSIIMVVCFSLFMTTPIESMIFHKERLQDMYKNKDMLSAAEFISHLDGDIMADDCFASRAPMLYAGRPILPFSGPEYPIYYNQFFKNARFKLSFSTYLKTDFYYLFKMDSALSIDNLAKTKYIYSNRIKNEAHVNNKNDKIFGSSSHNIYVSKANTPSEATLISPSGKSHTNTPTFAWNIEQSSTRYRLWINDPSDKKVFDKWYTSQGVTNGSICQITPDVTLIPGNSYTWWVQTWNDAGDGPWSSGMTFIVP